MIFYQYVDHGFYVLSSFFLKKTVYAHVLILYWSLNKRYLEAQQTDHVNRMIKINDGIYFVIVYTKWDL